MKFKQLFFYFFLFTFSTPIAFALDNIDELFEGTWAGVEVMGGDVKVANLVRDLIPIKVGDQFLPDSKKLGSWCSAVKEKINGSVSCGIIGYIEGKYYFDVEIISANTNNKFREFQTNSPAIEPLPEKLNTLYNYWEKIFEKYMREGAVPKQFYKEGYLQCDDPELQLIAKELSQITPTYNPLLLDIIRYSHDADERTTAAALLSWSKHPENISVIMKENLLNDPDSGVRNELARSVSYIISDVKNKKILKKSIVSLCEQLKLPSHSDRTKALASFLTIIKHNPELTSVINHECGDTLTYVSTMSILPNVGGTAKEILASVKHEDTHFNSPK